MDMKPGRDLDCKIAVDVMGYRWITHMLKFSAELQVKWLGSPQELAESGGVYIPVTKAEDFQALKLREGFADSVPLYSTDVAAAQLVVTRMQELGYQCEQQVLADEVRVSFYGPAGGAEVAAGSAPEAIVMAALLSVE